MLDLNAELLVLQVIPLTVGASATITGAAIAVDTLNTGDLDMASLNIPAVTGSGSITVALQGSQTGTGGWTPLAVNALMTATSFVAVTAAMAAGTPVTIPIDPRGLTPFIRAVATLVGFSAYTIELQLFARNAQIGFNTNSG